MLLSVQSMDLPPSPSASVSSLTHLYDSTPALSLSPPFKRGVKKQHAGRQDLCHAATKIQASFRGHQARRQTQAEKDKEAQELQDKEDVEKIDLTDPDLNKAATKIQASFRGHKVRKDVPN
ncbi:hypothetical protein evm_005430 [Chilo suppressalis]|nr:hypothetical protein evm_005430 [Chilo suppressalis]